MRFITHTCPDCGTIVAANELESNRVMKCPGLGCHEVLRFDALPDEARDHFLSNREEYDPDSVPLRPQFEGVLNRV